MFGALTVEVTLISKAPCVAPVDTNIDANAVLTLALVPVKLTVVIDEVNALPKLGVKPEVLANRNVVPAGAFGIDTDTNNTSLLAKSVTANTGAT